jgi:hypothetical protein
LDSEIRILRSLITIQLGDDVVEIAAARWSVEHAYFDTKSSSRSRPLALLPLALLREQLLRENRRSAGPFSHPLVSRLSVADRWPDSQPDEDMDQEMARSICSAFGLVPHDADSKRPAATSESKDDSIVLTHKLRWHSAEQPMAANSETSPTPLSGKRMRRPKFLKAAGQWRGLSVAELARSSGFPGKSPEVYATSATNSP